MSRLYKSPPLVEAVCEFRFVPSQPWDWTLPGLLYAKLGPDRYPHKEQRNVFEVALQQGAEEAKRQIRGGMPRMRFLDQERRRMVQVGPDLLAVNCLGAYPGWAAFKPWALDVLEAYVQQNAPEAISRVGVRYINHIRVPAPQVGIEDYVRAVPHVPKPVRQVFGPFMMRVEIPMPDKECALALQSASIQPPGFEGVAFLFDLDCITRSERPFPTGQCGDRMEVGHEVVEEAFETCLGPKARALFEEVVPDGCAPGQ